MTQAYVHIENISKSYGDVKALKDVSLEIMKNELFGFIGPDGAGKTSLFRMITTLLTPDKGVIKVNGLNTIKDYKALRKNIGYMPGKFSLYQDLSVEENLEFFASVFGSKVNENYYLIEPIYKHLEPFRKRKAAKLSGGMKQKLALCCALIHKPDLLVLDEPTTGVDAVSRYEFWQMLQNLKEFGITIIVSTPYMDEASLCDRVALIQSGNILTVASPNEIIKSFPKRLFALQSYNKSLLIELLEKHIAVDSVFAFGSKVHITLKDDNFNIENLIIELKSTLKDVIYNGIEANIEDCFLLLRQTDED